TGAYAHAAARPGVPRQAHARLCRVPCGLRSVDDRRGRLHRAMRIGGCWAQAWEARAIMVDRASPRRKAAEVETANSPEAAAGRTPAPKLDKKTFDKKTIAFVYDFDGTLSPRPMQEYAFLPKIGADPAAFWAESNALASEARADPLITYMHLMY